MTTQPTLPLSSIKVSDTRQRKAIDEAKLIELAASIERLGLLQPLVVRQDGELVAGERRLKAVTHLGWEQVPVVYLESLDPDDAFEAELEENIRRVDLPWQDRVRAEAELHKRRTKQAEARGETQSLSATTREIFDTDTPAPTQLLHLRDALVLERHLSDPEVNKSTSIKDAMKVIRRKAESEHRATLASLFNPTATPHEALLGDALTLLASFDSGQFDCILTDPPYGISADDFGSQAKTGHAYSDSPDDYRELVGTLAMESYRVAKPEAHLYMFLDFRWWDTVKLNFELAGWKVWHRPLIWSKRNGMLPQPEYGPRNTYELILFANKGPRRTLAVKEDVIDVTPVTTLKHGAQKPVALYVDLLTRSVLPGDRILDPFMGSGTIFAAANALRLQATGIEMVEDSYNIALTRINETLTEEVLT